MIQNILAPTSNNNDQSQNLQNAPKPTNKPLLQYSEFKIPDIEFPLMTANHLNFQLEVCKLVQANCVITELIKEVVIEKYTLSQKIHQVLEQIKKLENKPK